ncbi:hypothetical protein M8C21_022750 [Ambrosia artemisiifolia]|uniref:Uncharacterized protein n=1 Tax=Ambrosia artemisiifolia TaxID=4212 RepID=A0AAD5CFE6_AMBAR|nr:hypothetical protein M8C21_022750 [Ambrosia artemisiifolia]
MTSHRKNKILIIAYPNQGHINPSLRFVNRLLKLNVDVTYSTSVSVIRRIEMQTTHHNITFAPFSDDHDDGKQPNTTFEQQYSDFATKGSCAIAEIISSTKAVGQPFDHLVYTSAVPWAAKVAYDHSLKSTLLWCQPATVLDIYYYYFNGYQDLISCNNNNPMFPINLPGLPSLTTADLPSFMLSSCPKEHKFVMEFMKEHSIRAVDKLVMLPVGPLVPDEFFEERGPLNNSLGCDLFEKPEEDYVKWLNAKPKLSVVYVSFGSLSSLSIDQVEEIASGLVESRRPFLWVIREGGQTAKLSKIEVLKEQGMIVSWCSQVEVLNHQAIGCFLMHGGWNSTIESLAAGVPTVVFSQWSDQMTNAKMVEDVWKTGVKMKKREGDGMMEGKEIKRCVEMMMEDEEVRRNAKKWRKLARQALNDGGSKNKILIVTYPSQGQINPSLNFANRLVMLGVNVTFCTSFTVIRRIDTQTTHHGLTFAPFSDGNDTDRQPTLQQFFLDFVTNGIRALEEIIRSATAAGQPFDHLVYTTVVPWAAKLAHAHSLESTLLWCQPATVLDIYYYYFNGYHDLISCSNNNNTTFSINLPGLPSLTTTDLPSLLLPSCPEEYLFIIQIMKDHIDVLKISPRILVNTFNELEVEPIRAIKELVMLPIGPLMPLEFIDGSGPTKSSLGCDLFEKQEEDYIKWLNTKPKLSVVYASFGSLATLSMDQAEEMASGLLESGRPFLWVIREGGQAAKLSKIEVLKQKGMIVSWCSQVEVLNHQAIGCFVTHCGWNSTLETLAAGVPTVAFSQWSDQVTNAKMIEDVWKTGVKVRRREGDGMVEGKEIKRCVEKVMEDEEIRRNAEKWRESTRKAIDNEGSSALNLQAFLYDA